MLVEYNGKEYKVKEKGGVLSLDLSGLEIKDITQINGLDSLTYLQLLDLSRNQITEIKGLDNLTSLVDLQFEHNQIEVIKGLDKLEELQILNLYKNKISQIKSFKNKNNLRDILLGGNPIFSSIKSTLGRVTPQVVVKFSQMSIEARKKAENILIEEEKNYVLELEREIREKERARKSANRLFSFQRPSLCECIVILIVVLIVVSLFAISGLIMRILNFIAGGGGF